MMGFVHRVREFFKKMDYLGVRDVGIDVIGRSATLFPARGTPTRISYRRLETIAPYLPMETRGFLRTSLRAALDKLNAEEASIPESGQQRAFYIQLSQRLERSYV